MPDLIVNLDHLAVLRQRRRTREPDPIAAAVIAELAGANGISVNLRSDRRFIQERDVRILREIVKTSFHLSLPASNDSVKLAFAVKPDFVTIVSERKDEVSPSVGLDVMLNQAQLKPIVRALKEVGVVVAVLVDPDIDQIKACLTINADAVMLNTRLYGDSAREREIAQELERIETSARVARKNGLEVAAGHGLDVKNAARIARIGDINRVEIGHGIVARAVFMGLDSAIREMAAIVRSNELPPP